jgi:hypothetical protein
MVFETDLVEAVVVAVVVTGPGFAVRSNSCSSRCNLKPQNNRKPTVIRASDRG